MKKTLLAAVSLLLISNANAQSSVTLYGLLETGITYANSQGGHKNVYLDSGVMNGNRWGLLGSEDLGGGLKAIFNLENGFSLSNGTFGNGGAEFGRTAYVGLSSPTWGSVKMGRQADMMVEMFYYANTGYQGFYAVHEYDIDRLAGEQVINAVKYTTPSIFGVVANAMYGFSNAAGAFAGNNGNPRATSFDAKFEGHGPLSLIVAYTNITGQGGAGTTTADLNVLGNYHTRMGGVGARYNFSPVTLVYASLYHTRQINLADTSHVSNTSLDVGGQYGITPTLMITPGYTYGHMTQGNYSQFNLVLDYFLSKRTDVFAGAYYQKSMSAGFNAGLPDIASLSTPNTGFSTTDKQIALRVGIRSRF